MPVVPGGPSIDTDPVPSDCKTSDIFRFVVNERAPLPATIKKLVFGLSWNAEDIDLDLSACLFDHAGQFQESIYFGNLSDSKGSVMHTGDSKTGGDEEDDDEEVVVDVAKLPPSTSFVVITISSYAGHQLQDVKSASAKVTNSTGGRKGDRMIGRVKLPMNECKDKTGMLLCKLYKQEGKWWSHTMCEPVQGRHFADLLAAMQKSLRDVLPSIQINPRPDVMVLTKGETVNLVTKEGLNLKFITMGLGWDAAKRGASIDLDASCVMFDSKNKFVEAVSFSNLSSNNRSVRHGGDNLTGDGDGDDEQIFVDLDRLNRSITSLFFIVNSYSGQAFSGVRNAYVRLLDGPKNSAKELMRFQLSGAGNPKHTAMLMCKLSRVFEGGSSWKLKTLGYGTKGSMYQDNLKDMSKELAGRLKLGKNGRFDFKPQHGLQQAQQVAAKSSDNTNFLLILLVLLLAVVYVNLTTM